MKKELAVFIASTFAILFATVTANAYVFDNFESPGQTPGSPPSGWGYANGVLVSNVGVKIDNASLYIPTTLGVTNLAGAAGTKIWTDFYTVPRPFVSGSQDAPTIDSNATAQFFVNTNGLWVTISGNGGSGFQTNTWTQPVLAGMTYPTVTQYSAFYHVSVLHDYSASNWSMFVNEVLLATNLQFISSGVSAHAWFQVQNLGGNGTNVCWLDNFLVTNKIATTTTTNGMTNAVPGTTIPVVDALAHFGSVQDPRPTNKTVGVVGAGGVGLTFGRVVADGRQYVVYGTPQYNLSGLSSNGVLSGNSYTDNVSLVSGTRQYYKLVTVSSDGGAALTNDETYAAYKQFRAAGSTYIMGVPLEYVNSSDRSMGGQMGLQLGSGVSASDVLTITTNGVSYTYRWNGVQWNWLSGTGPADSSCTKQWGAGVGMALTRGSSGGSTVSYFAGIKETNAVSVAVPSGAWTYLTWPHNDAAFNNGSVLGFAATTGDYIYIQTNGAANFVPARFNGTTWNTRMNGTGPALSLNLGPGDGIVYRTAGASKTFVSTGP